MKNIKQKNSFSLSGILSSVLHGCLLSVIIFPFFKGTAQDTSEVTSLGNNGRKIWQGIVAANIEREAMGMSSVWPSKGVYKSSNEYFYKLLDKEVLQLSTAVFSGRGVAAASNIEDIRNRGVAWNMIAGGEDYSFLPFIYTRNLRGLTEAELKAPLNSKPVHWKSKLNPSIDPLRDKQMVFVTYGGSMVVASSKDLTNVLFMNGELDVSEVVEVVEAKYNDL